MPGGSWRPDIPLTKRPPGTGGLLVTQSGLARGVAHGVLGIAGRIMGGALRLIHFALGLHLLVAGNLAGRVLDGTFDLVGGTFDVFAIHVRLLSKSRRGRTSKPVDGSPATSQPLCAQ